MSTWQREWLGSFVEEPKDRLALWLWAVYYTTLDKLDRELAERQAKEMRLPLDMIVRPSRRSRSQIYLHGGYRSISVQAARRMMRALQQMMKHFEISDDSLRWAKEQALRLLDEGGERGQKELDEIVAAVPPEIEELRRERLLQDLLRDHVLQIESISNELLDRELGRYRSGF